MRSLPCIRLPKQQLLLAAISGGLSRCHFTRHSRLLTTLAIETSCDDTAVAVLHRTSSANGSLKKPTHKLLFSDRRTSDHRSTRGIEPVVAARGHQAALEPLLRQAIAHLPSAESSSALDGDGRIVHDHAGRARCKPDFVCVTRGPGILPNLSIGLSFAKGVAAAWDVPIVGVHHMQAHALTPRLVRALGERMMNEVEGEKSTSSSFQEPEFPFLSLLVSGGHTQLVHSESTASHRVIATTADVAVGNALDHAARQILPSEVLDAVPDVMYARHLEAFAFPDGGTSEEYAFWEPPRKRTNDDEDLAPQGSTWSLPQPFRMSRKLAFSFAALGSTVGRIVDATPDLSVSERRAVARYLQAAAFQHLSTRTVLALEDNPSLRDTRSIVIAGGVACNRFLPHVLRSTLEARGLGGRNILVPPAKYCADNAVMIAYAGMCMWEEGWCSGFDMLPFNRWTMDPVAGAGILGVHGWLRRPGFG